MKAGMLCCLLLFLSFVQGNRETTANVKLNKLTEGHQLLKEQDEIRSRTESFPIAKRGLGSVLLIGTAVATHLANLGLTLSSAISQGCNLYPRICENVKAIEKIEDDYKKEREDYKKMLEEHNRNYVDYRTAVTNNGMIVYFINETMKNIESLSEWQSQLCAKLEIFYPISSELVNITKEDDFKKYLLTLNLERLEYTLKDIKNMIQNQQKMQLTGLAVQLLSEAAIYKFAKSVKKAYGQLSPEDLFKGSRIQSILGESEKTSKFAFKTKFIIVPKVLNQMAKNAKDYVLKIVQKLKAVGQYSVDKINSIENFLITEGWKGVGRNLKTIIKNKFRSLGIKYRSVKARVQTKLKALKTFTLSKFQIGMSVVSIISDAVSIGLNIVEWRKKDDEIERSKRQYEIRLAELRRAKNELIAESRRVEHDWNDVINSFRNTSTSFEFAVANFTKYSDFIHVIGLTGIHANASEALLSVNYEKVNRSNIIESQESVIRFMRENDNNLTAINDALRARSVLYDYVAEETNTSSGISKMTEFLHSVYRFDASSVVRSFGEKLEKKDVVCAVAMIRADKKVYDFYPLSPFRPRCEINDTLYVEMEKSASKQHNLKIMNDVIDIELQKDSVIGLPEMLITVQNAYQIQGSLSLTKFADSITERDILCRIAQKYSLTEFDYIPLSSFRDNCTGISDRDLNNLKEKASKLKILHSSMMSLMKTCTLFRMCPCVSVISSTLGASEEDIKMLIKQMYPEKKTYCGTGCPCMPL